MIEKYRGASVAPKNLVLVGHLHWRLQFKGTNDPQASYVSPAEINFREVVGTDSLMNGTLSASSTYNVAGYEANKAIDNNAGTCWICGMGLWNNSWWRMSTAAVRNVKQVKLQAFNTAPGAAQMPSAFELQWSDDGTAWTTVLTVTGQTGWTASQIRTFNVP